MTEICSIPLEVELPTAILEAMKEYQKRNPHLSLNDIAILGIQFVVYSQPHV